MIDRLLTDLNVATMNPASTGLGIMANAAIAIDRGRIAWVGPEANLPPVMRNAARHDGLDGRWVTPGLIDCHTHLVFAGDRSSEFERRIAGESYADIAKSGGGIASTVKATAAANEEELVAAAIPRAEALMAEGVTTIEVKSGYGVKTNAELTQLRAARALGSKLNVDIEPTLLALHVAPRGESRAAFVERVCVEMIPQAATEGLATSVDAFLETIAFKAPEVETVFAAAKACGLKVKLHADQLSDGGGAALAARFGALSADHLEFTSAEGASAMAAAGTVAVMLPGAFLMLGETKRPPVAIMREAGCAFAVASDLNPGSSPISSLRLSATLACVLFGLTVEEVWLGMTRNAAKALGRSDIGMVREGMRADLAVWSVQTLAEVVAKVGDRPLHMRIWNGQ